MTFHTCDMYDECTYTNEYNAAVAFAFIGNGSC